jgi:hypothetical protein
MAVARQSEVDQSVNGEAGRFAESSGDIDIAVQSLA